MEHMSLKSKARRVILSAESIRKSNTVLYHVSTQAVVREMLCFCEDKNDPFSAGFRAHIIDHVQEAAVGE